MSKFYKLDYGFYSRGTRRDRVTFKAGDVIQPTEDELRKLGNQLVPAEDADKETGTAAPIITPEMEREEEQGNTPKVEEKRTGGRRRNS